MTKLFDDLQWRGLVHSITSPELPALLDHGSLTAYIGFDPTADSLTIGHLLQIVNLMRFQTGGHQPIALAGGGTGMIGDPGGKSEERNLLSREEVKANVESIRLQLERFLDFSGDHGALLLDNGDWLWSIGLLEFLRDVGKHFTVNQMVAKESVKARLENREQGISFTEFSYMLLQSYDFLHLFDHHNCTLQLGASDQWGNITMGVDLIRRVRSAEAFGLVTPLVLKSDGTKFGKSESGNLWLDPRRTSPYALFQAMIRTEDSLVGQYLRYFTLLPHERIEELDSATAEHPERREAQRVLAREITTLVHGRNEADGAERAAGALFSEEIAELDEAMLLDVFSDAPSTTLARTRLEGPGLSLVDALAETRLCGSKGDARRTVEQGGAYVNNRQVRDAAATITTGDLLHDRYVVLRRGKRDHHLVRFSG